MRRALASWVVLGLLACHDRANERRARKPRARARHPRPSSSPRRRRGHEAQRTSAARRRRIDLSDIGEARASPSRATTPQDRYLGRRTEPTVMGRLPPEVVARVFRRLTPAFRDCYRVTLTREPERPVTVATDFVIATSGAVAAQRRAAPRTTRCSSRASEAAPGAPLSAAGGRRREGHFPLQLEPPAYAFTIGGKSSAADDQRRSSQGARSRWLQGHRRRPTEVATRSRALRFNAERAGVGLALTFDPSAALSLVAYQA